MLVYLDPRRLETRLNKSFMILRIHKNTHSSFSFFFSLSFYARFIIDTNNSCVYTVRCTEIARSNIDSMKID